MKFNNIFIIFKPKHSAQYYYAAYLKFLAVFHWRRWVSHFKPSASDEDRSGERSSAGMSDPSAVTWISWTLATNPPTWPTDLTSESSTEITSFNWACLSAVSTLPSPQAPPLPTTWLTSLLSSRGLTVCLLKWTRIWDSLTLFSWTPGPSYPGCSSDSS